MIIDLRAAARVIPLTALMLSACVSEKWGDASWHRHSLSRRAAPDI
jgi:hypothetical protein